MCLWDSPSLATTDDVVRASDDGELVVDILLLPLVVVSPPPASLVPPPPPPFRLVFTASSDKYIKPRLRDFSYLALGLNTLLAAGWAVYSMKKRRCRTIRVLGILVLGIYLLVPLLLTDRE